MQKCVYCGQRKGKRPCPALQGMIEPSCCGAHANKQIACPPDCKYLAQLATTGYQKSIEKERQALQALGPDGDVLRASPLHAQFAAVVEQVAVGTYRLALEKGENFEDRHVDGFYRTLLARVYDGYSGPVANAGVDWSMFEAAVKKFEREGLGKGEQRKIVIRLLTSVTAMTGGRAGPTGYLDYLNQGMGL